MQTLYHKLENLLSNIKKTGRQKFTAKCPAHDDNKNSLSVTLADGKTLLHCFAGCTYEQILSSLNIKNDFNNAPNSKIKSTRTLSSDITADFIDKISKFKNDAHLDNSLLKFIKENSSATLADLPVGYDVTTKSIVYIYYNLKNQPVNLKFIKYGDNLHRLKDNDITQKKIQENILVGFFNEKVFTDNDIIFIVESEKSALLMNTILKLPSIATGGATQFSTKGIWNNFPHKKFILLPDNDMPGITWNDKLKSFMDDAGVTHLTIKLCKIISGMTESEDIGDLIIKGILYKDENEGLISNLLQLLNDKIYFAKKIKKEILDARKWSDFNKNQSKNEYIISDILMKGTLNALVGPPDTGKSLFIRQLLLFFIKGNSKFIGFNIESHYNCLYISTEDTEESINLTLSKQMDILQIDNSLRDNLFILNYNGESDQDISSIIEDNITDNSIDIVVIDTFSDIFKGKDISDNAQMRKALKPFSNLTNTYGVTFILIHHIAKSEYSNKPRQEAVMGAASFVQKVRLVMDLRNDENDLNNKLFTITKGNYVSRKIKNLAYTFNFDENNFFFSYLDSTDINFKSLDSDITSFDYHDWANSLVDNSLIKDVINNIIDEYGVNKSTAYKYLNKAIKVGLIKRRGKYLIKPPNYS